MLIDIQNTHESAGLTKVCDFRISTNGIMVKALTSRLYSNPIASIVRELASNALDACPTQPMEIHIPTQFDSNFWVRDHGPGLSRSQMIEVFTRFGESTKRSDNSQIGGFGLGAKSPFAIVNSYTIRSCHQGVETTYIASIGADGMPGLHEISSQPTSDTGLTIIVPASPDPRWEEALQQVRFFNPRPIIKGCDFQFVDATYDCADFMVLPGGEPSVMVGPVAYPLDTSKLNISSYRAPPVALKFPIGGIEVTASREEIVYNSVTISKLIASMQEARIQYDKIVNDLVSRCTTLPAAWDVLKGTVFNPLRTFLGKSGRTYSFTRHHIHLTVDGRRLVPRELRRRKWNLHYDPHSVDVGPDEIIFHVDDNRKVQDRIEAYLTSINWDHRRAIVVSTSRDDFDDLGIPVVPISSIPYNKPMRSSPQPRRYRAFNVKDKLTVHPGPFTHYLRVTEDLHFRGVRLTHSIVTAMENRISTRFCIVPPNFKGKLDGLADAAPLWEKAAADCVAAKGQDIANSFAYPTDGWNRLLRRSLTFHGILSPQPLDYDKSELLDISALGLLPPASIDYEGEMNAALKKYPELKLLYNRGFDNNMSIYLHKLVSLIVKE